MGLDIECNGMYERVGSYSSVHINRRVLLECALYYVKDKIEKMDAISLVTQTFPQEYVDINETEEQQDIIIETTISLTYDKPNESQQYFNLIQLKEHLEKVLTPKVRTTYYKRSDGTTQQFDSVDEINYDYFIVKFSEIESCLEQNGLIGIMYWVNHSDCEGRISSNEAKEIIEFLSKTINTSLKYFAEKEKTTSEETNQRNKYTIFDYLDGGITSENYMEQDLEDIYKSYYLYDIFYESVESGEDIVFC